MTIEVDHIGITVSDYAKAKKFYAAALAPLRMTAIMEYGGADTGGEPIAGFGADGKPFFWIGGGGKTTPHTHIAIRAETRAQVDAFYAAAIAAGGKDNGGPGVREMYHPNYYGAFVLDPDGHNIEAVCHTPASVAIRSAGRKSARKASAKPARKAAAKGSRKATPAKRAAARKPAKKVAARKPAGRGKRKK